MAKNLTLVACVDDHLGMTFCGRRQSKDRVQRARLMALLGGKRLWMSPYSAKLFGELEGVCAHENYARKAKTGDALFAEDSIPSLKGVDTVVLYDWNEYYPSDVSFPYDLEKEGFALESAEEFVGSSHKNITERIYKRV